MIDNADVDVGTVVIESVDIVATVSAAIIDSAVIVVINSVVAVIDSV